MSIGNVLHFRRTGTLPDLVAADPTFDAQTKDAFSSNPRPEFEDDEDEDFRSSGRRIGTSNITASAIATDDRRSSDNDEDYALLHQNEMDDLGPIRTPYDPTNSSSVMYGDGGGNNGSPLYGAGGAGGGGQRYEPSSPSIYSRGTFR